MSQNNTQDVKCLTKKLNACLTSIDKKALEGLTIIAYLEKDTDLDAGAEANLDRWKRKLNEMREE